MNPKRARRRSCACPRERMGQPLSRRARAKGTGADCRQTSPNTRTEEEAAALKALEDNQCCLSLGESSGQNSIECAEIKGNGMNSVRQSTWRPCGSVPESHSLAGASGSYPAIAPISARSASEDPAIESPGLIGPSRALRANMRNLEALSQNPTHSLALPARGGLTAG